MIRALLALAAVVVAVLAFVLDRPWLYGAAAASLVGVLGDLGRHFWATYRRDARADTLPEEPASAPDDSLEELGIMDVRPQDPSDSARSEASPSPAAGAEGGAPAESAAETTPAHTASSAEAASDSWPDTASSEEERASMSGPTDGVSASRYTDDRPVLGPLLESLRAAIGAQSVSLLVQEEVALEYGIEALASMRSDVQDTGTFETQEPLLSATMSRQPVTVHSIDPPRRSDLGYYQTAPAITQVALAPIAQPDTSATLFLLADATAEVDLGTRQTRTLLERFAETVAVLLDADVPTAGEGAATEQLPSFDAPTPEDGEPQTDGGRDSDRDSDRESDAAAADAPRPRREIIAEEMQAADAANDALALVLVHLNRAETIARRGEEAVAATEQHLRTRLEDLAPGPRIERFGELTYGIFVRGGVDTVEGWAADLQETMARETGRLEGGVSVGVAVRHDDHDPEGLRADATDALLEAYETGTCTIIA